MAVGDTPCNQTKQSVNDQPKSKAQLDKEKTEDVKKAGTSATLEVQVGLAETPLSNSTLGERTRKLIDLFIASFNEPRASAYRIGRLAVLTSLTGLYIFYGISAEHLVLEAFDLTVVEIRGALKLRLSAERKAFKAQRKEIIKSSSFLDYHTRMANLIKQQKAEKRALKYRLDTLRGHIVNFLQTRGTSDAS
jgi:hypothetical protein